MTPLILWLIAGAIMLVALGILLWQSAQDRLRQQATSSFVDQQIINFSQQQQVIPEISDMGESALPKTYINSRIHDFCLRAGIVPNRSFLIRILLPCVVLVLLAALFGGTLSAILTLLLYVTLAYFHFWLKAVKRHQRMCRQLPSFLDTMVRLTTIGNSLESAYQSALLSSDAPLREVLDRANRLVQAGIDLEHALIQQARTFKIPELELIGAIIGIALRFGGRADTVLERMAAFMRDREQAQNELTALSAEIRLSAWVLGLLPIGIGMFMIIFNNKMFMMMLEDPIGKNMLIGAALLEVIGAYGLYRLAKSV